MDLLTNLFTLLDMKSSVAVLCLLAATMIFMNTEAHNPEYKKANLAGPKVIRKRAIITEGTLDVTGQQRSSMYQDE